MLIGVPREIKADEYRVGMTPTTVRELSTKGHRVLVEGAAGVGAGISDQEYIAAGAEIVAGAEQIAIQGCIGRLNDKIKKGGLVVILC